jgi:hypothetical protein
LLTRAVAGAPADDPYRATYLAKLGSAWLHRFVWKGTPTDVDAAIDVIRAARQLGPGTPATLTNLAMALRMRFEVAGDDADLDQAVELALEAADSSPVDDPDRSGRLFNAATTLVARFEH